MISYDIPLTFLLQLRANDILPWAAAAPGIDYLIAMLNREPAYEHFRVSACACVFKIRQKCQKPGVTLSLLSANGHQNLML